MAHLIGFMKKNWIAAMVSAGRRMENPLRTGKSMPTKSKTI